MQCERTITLPHTVYEFFSLWLSFSQHFLLVWNNCNLQPEHLQTWYAWLLKNYGVQCTRNITLPSTNIELFLLWPSLYPRKQSLLKVYCNQLVWWSGGWSVLKILSGQLLLQIQSNSLDPWQKCSLGPVDLQDTHFVKIPSRITELLPLIWLKNACLDNSSYSICLIHFKLGRSVH